MKTSWISALSVLLCLAACGLAQDPNVKPPNKNRSAKYKSAIFRGSGNLIWSNSLASFIGGGQQNTIGLVSGFGTWNAYNSVIAGGRRNTVLREVAVIGGGNFNTNEATAGTIAGGQRNRVAAPYTAIGGGIYNTNIGYAATIAGGYENLATAHFAAVGGGETNYATGVGATVAGGSLNEANGANSAIGGGFNNETTGSLATIPGGNGNSATNYSFAAGRYASAKHDGSFVWGSQTGIVFTPTDSFAANTFTVRCQGGARFYTANGTGTGVELEPLDTSWGTLSDSNAKTGFAPIKSREILSKVAALPVTSWHYKHNPNRRYIGPMAQDFHASFGLGGDDKKITTLDSDGIMYAAIQGLVEELKERDKQIEDLKLKSKEVDSLKKKLEIVEERLGLLPPAP